MDKIKFVVATRLSEADFFTKSAAGRSLRLYRYPFVQIKLFPQNKRGLSEVYNAIIEESRSDPAGLVFCHDDVHLLDFYWTDQIQMGLDEFQIIGVAGNKRRVPRQPSWAFVDTNLTRDNPANLSGIVGHGQGFPPSDLSIYGPTSQRVKLLDGLLLAAHSDVLIKNNLRFDERFDFHFYDLDFCRQAEVLGLACGTWPLSLVHESGGSFGSEGWRNSYQKYLAKWGD